MKHAQYDTVLMCELETKIKAKKQAEQKIDLAYGTSTDDKEGDDETIQ